ncbi:MAG: tRNA (N6-threonylcarbamoyladenosine(37)-N6)-methyltransferase TrmO [Thermodesulfobacteriota bacterium]|nr:tRNA (N6-threonylcarbamoyladenosine(37)-N6)-methyltransferase TrmO [Thermodesulfobacteriota bacterium]
MSSKNAESMMIKPVGIVKSSILAPSLKGDDKNISATEKKEEMKKQHKKIKDGISEIIIDDKFNGILDGIEDFSHILVLYWPHMLPETSRSIVKVNPMGRKDLPEKGVFATCSPARPNPILVTAVPLLSRKDNVLKVQGFEAVNESPVIDIKPYILHYYGPENVTIADWMRKITEEMDE